jgi:hypothetical protein
MKQYLLVRSRQPENAYGLFTQEILRSEGLMGFEPVDLDTAGWPDVSPGDLLLLTRCLLRKAELDRLHEAARDGARVVVLQPQCTLLERLGCLPAWQVVYPGRVCIHGDGSGAGAAIQTHLPVNCVDLPDGWQWLATAALPDGEQTQFPAAAKAAFGKGEIALFFYDLSEAIARIRFGNPDLASYVTVTSRWPWPHTADLFEGHLDPAVSHLPQADMHAQLLAEVLTGVSAEPLGRLWYYQEPEHRTVAVFESDGDHSEPEHFFTLAESLERRGGKATFYLMKSTKLDDGKVEELRLRGHTFGPHVNPRGVDEELYFAIPEALENETAAFRDRYGECSPTLQCHCAPWKGYLSLIPHHIRNGYRLLFAYVSLPERNWGRYMCGSGRPLKFYDGLDGLQDCWQQPIICMDDTTLVDKLTHRREETFEEFEERLQNALNLHHTAFGILSHPSSFCQYSGPLMERCFDRLVEMGVPIYNADAWCRFLDTRQAVHVKQSSEGPEQTVYVVSGLKGRLPLMIPVQDGAADPQIYVDESAADAIRDQRLSQDYLFVSLEGDSGGTPIHVVVRNALSQPAPDGGSR